MGLNSLLSNAESTTYVLCIKGRKKTFFLFLDKKKKQLCWQLHIFVWSEESSDFFGFGLVIGFYIFFWNMKRVEDRLITFKKIWEFIIIISNLSNWAWEPNESKDSCLVREGIVEVLKWMERQSTFIKWFIR